MTVYVIADVKVTDGSWISEYAKHVHDIAARHGGKYLSRSENIHTIAGKPLDTSVIALMSFPTMAAVEAFANDPEYAPYAKARTEGSISNLHVIDDTDAAGSIPYLPTNKPAKEHA
ncbi:hypothetical protein ROA7450_03192 [Roseovarius albus]|uniref:DUF1330 domain-containing protein n=1 Tax=Roseovarius albus TaxID=1247867 RepID=A0A1X6ZW97_9RHOB|nr:DUF1330 domain-containing protein [Roseovarius albus]SLN61536.1 hypothetical protein ROA7450_03192 [Roseovarius albus]